MAYSYDDQNIFAKILRGEIPNNTVAETDYSLAFRDIAPRASTHVLVIPKGPYVTADHFSEAATDAEIVDFWRLVGQIAASEGVAPDHGNGFRLIANAGADAVQEVPHFHIHLIGGKALGPILAPGL